MPRLQFDLKPLPVPFAETPEGWAEHEVWLKKVFETHHPNETPRPCDCGYFEPTHPVSCDEEHRRRFCHRDPMKRLGHHYREAHLKLVRERREYPGPLFPRAEMGTCKGCGEGIFREGPPPRKVDRRRNWHPECSHAHNLRTDRDTQVTFLIERDGLGCKGCGEIVGHWKAPFGGYGDGADINPDALRSWGPTWVKAYPRDVFVGQFCHATWTTNMEVDHVVALGLVAHLEVEERRSYFDPPNLALLCGPCHNRKTKSDTAAIRARQRELSQSPAA